MVLCDRFIARKKEESGMRDYVSHACMTTNERAMQVFDRLNSLVNLVIGAVNTIAGNGYVRRNRAHQGHAIFPSEC